ncbi:hypothetical protein BDR07DRAFT_1559266 [Suillus spraguei]|nr:hypothetical protein BDR07DRAFT_1559266 [Suillus spraguei]
MFTGMLTPFDNTKISSALETLPNELLLQIISEVVFSTWPEHGLDRSSPIAITATGWKGLRRADKTPSGIHAVTLTSRHLHDLANTVLYRTVVLDREKMSSSRLGRSGKVVITLAFLQDVVKRLAITHAPMHGDIAVFMLRKLGTKVSNSDIATIITACSGAHTITIPSQWAHVLRDIGKTAESSEGREVPGNPNFTELILDSYVDLAKTRCTTPPIAQWRPSAPSTPIHSLPATPSTTRPSTPDSSCTMTPVVLWVIYHRLLYSTMLPTFASQNQRMHENDELFIGAVKAILQEPEIQVVVITIFPQSGVGADKEEGVDRDASRLLDIKDSTIWLAAEELRKGDNRLFVVNGHSGSWRRDWQGPAVVARPTGPGNWWRKVMST